MSVRPSSRRAFHWGRDLHKQSPARWRRRASGRAGALVSVKYERSKTDASNLRRIVRDPTCPCIGVHRDSKTPICCNQCRMKVTLASRRPNRRARCPPTRIPSQRTPSPETKALCNNYLHCTGRNAQRHTTQSISPARRWQACTGYTVRLHCHYGVFMQCECR
jgi:hypothetical protein